jgi:BMFP domain-containing protein YqiC
MTATSKKESSALEKVNLVVSIVTALVAMAAGCFSFFAYDRAQKIEQVVQAKQTSRLQALDLGRKSAFDVQSDIALKVHVLEATQSTQASQFWVSWSISLSNRGNRNVTVTSMVLRLFKARLPGGGNFVGTLNPPWQQTPIKWEVVAERIYDKPEGGLDDYAAIGPMSPADRRYGELSVVIRDSPEAWVYVTAEVTLKSDEDIDSVVEWDYAQLATKEPRSEDPISR